jgi:dTDP-4-amino-4,6-dideoxygalactose transaminase
MIRERAVDLSTAPVPFHRPTRAGRELLYVRDSLDRATTGEPEHYVGRCERFLERSLGVGRVMLTTSCTHALEICALLLDLGAGDEVIIPSFTFVSCANAVALRGAHPVFADVRSDSPTLDPAAVERLITPRTKAIMLVNYAGISPDAGAFAALAARRGVMLIEDNAQGLFARQAGRCLGTFGSLSTVSFDAMKNITCGAGGALLINDPSFVVRAEIVREKGTDRAGFKRGEVDEYTWHDVGSNYSIADSLAAQLLAQLEERESIQLRRRVLWDRYREGLAEWAASCGIRLPYVPLDADQPYHMFYLIMPGARARDRFISRLQAAGISSAPHYAPLHRSPAALQRGLGGPCPVTDVIAATLVRLPLFTHMTTAQQERVIAAVVRAHP